MKHTYFKLRDGLVNCRLRFEQEKKGRVVYMGGSITGGGGWRDLVTEDLKKRFPGTEFNFINAGIGSMGSTPHSFRLSRDVLQRGPVDLLFIEAAVNDEVNGQTPLEMLRGMEGVVRQARLADPMMDIIMLHFADPAKIQVITNGKMPEVIQQHEKVADHYGVPSIDLAKEVAERIRAGEFTWAKDFQDLHPSLFGHQLYARSIARLQDAAWQQPLPADAKPASRKLPGKPLDEKSYFRGRLVDVKEAVLGEGWAIVPNWKPAAGATRPGFVNVPSLVSEKPGSTFKFKFNGTAVGIFVAAGPDAGTVEYRIDGGACALRNLFTQWSFGLHLPWAHVLNADLAPGPHELVLKVAGKSDTQSKGTAVRIMHLLVN
jgi:sialidase-1